MNATETSPITPAEIAEAEGVTADACVKATWAITAVINDAMAELEEFAEAFAALRGDETLAPIFRDVAGVLWAMDQFVGLQNGQLPYWALNGDRLAPPTKQQS